MAYRRRIIDDTLDELFPHLAAISLDGAKGVGKTATASERANSSFDLSVVNWRETLRADVEQVVEAAPPVLIDEWQLVPETWDTVKRAVDRDATGGRFLLAGSAGAPTDARIHSGAGRIVSLRMRPESIAERGIAEPTVSLTQLLSGSRPRITGRAAVGLAGYVDEILRSGFPGIRQLPNRARNAQLDSYAARIVERDLPENGVEVRRPMALRAWLTAYAAATAGDASYSNILDAATAGDGDKVSRATVDIYREHLTRLFILDPLPAWIPVFNPLKRLTAAPKHHLVDPALAARLVGVSRPALLRGEGTCPGSGPDTWLGALFESLTVQSVRVYAESANATTGHLRTRGDRSSPGREVDIIVEGEDRQVVALEVKLAATVSDRDVRHLNWLEEKIGDRLADKVIVTTGETAYRRKDGVAVVPLALLGA
ncbi:MAG: DUF4143 domain-containing protein [Promicromonosporaceae bacterium]|nr:DUF4143 domain-containing protein [Promicromonosporaceae bacterium]